MAGKERNDLALNLASLAPRCTVQGHAHAHGYAFWNSETHCLESSSFPTWVGCRTGSGEGRLYPHLVVGIGLYERPCLAVPRRKEKRLCVDKGWKIAYLIGERGCLSVCGLDNRGSLH